MSITKAEGKSKTESARGDLESHRAVVRQVLAELGAGADKELAYRALHGDTGAALTLSATLPT